MTACSRRRVGEFEAAIDGFNLRRCVGEIEAALDAIQAIALAIETLVDVGQVALHAGQVQLDRRHALAKMAKIVGDLVDLGADRPQLIEHQVLDRRRRSG